MAFALAGVLLVVTAAWIRSQVGQWIERNSLVRHPVGPDGVIVGASPIDMHGTGPGAVLLLHGFGDTPQSLAIVAQELHRRGWTVRAPLLPGHGRTLPDFARSDSRAWLAAARAELAQIRTQHDDVALGGLSLGGGLATLLAADDPTIIAMVLFAPYLEMPRWLRSIARLHGLIDAVVPYWSGSDPRSIHNAEARAQSLAHRAGTARLVSELASLAREAQAALPRVTAPTLIIQSPADNRVRPAVAERALARLGSRERRLVWTREGGHIITVDNGVHEVARITGEWFDDHMTQQTALRNSLTVPPVRPDVV